MSSLSVIIPSFNGAERLPRLLEALQPQIEDGDEIIVANDASTDSTSEVLRSYPVREVVLENNSGVGAARNRGAQAATSDILLFFDDDIIPFDNYLEEARQLFSDETMSCCQGLHSLEPANLNPSLGHRVEALLWRHEMGSHQTRSSLCYSLFSQSFCIRKSLFFEVGGFTEVFSGAGAEEFELASRLMERGNIRFAPKLETQHMFQSFFPRLKTLLVRSARFPEVYRGANSHWQKNQWFEIVCVGLATIFVLSLLGGGISSFFFHGIWVSIVGFLIVDFSLVRNSLKWQAFHLFPLAFVTRLLQYCMIGGGATIGFVKLYVRRR